MTGVNAIVRRDRATIITDSAYYDESGFIQGFAPKVVILSHWPGMIAMRGPIYALARLAAEAGLRFPDVDAFAEGARVFLEEFFEEHCHMLGSWGEPAGLQITVAGFSAARNACRAFMIQVGEAPMLEGERTAVASGTGAMIPTHRILELPYDEMVTTPALTEVERAAVGIDPDLNVGRLDMAGEKRLALKMLNGQRRLSAAMIPGTEPFHFVGGRALFATVFRDGTILTSTGPFWPDRIGERIDPSQDLPGDLKAAAAHAA